MSICPENDIHSVYLDGELPAEFNSEYEAHVSSCAECSARLERLRKLRSLFAEDSASISFTKAQLDESYGRLTARLSYAKTLKSSEENSFVKNFRQGGSKYFAAGIAAAAVFAFLIPLNVSLGTSRSGVAQSSFIPVARTTISSVANQVRMDETVSAANIGFLDSDSEDGDGMYAVYGASSAVPQMVSMNSSVGARNRRKLPLASYDVFSPAVEQSVAGDSKPHDFSLQLSSPLVNVTFKIGN